MSAWFLVGMVVEVDARSGKWCVVERRQQGRQEFGFPINFVPAAKPGISKGKGTPTGGARARLPSFSFRLPKLDLRAIGINNPREFTKRV